MYDTDFYNVNKRDFECRNSMVSGAAGLPAATESGAKRSSRLEYNINNLENKRDPFTRINVVPHHCDCRVCPDCGKRRGYQTRNILLSDENLEKFTVPVLMSFTIDPKINPDPEKVYNFVRNNSLVSALMKMLKIKVWVWVLEFQKNGNPHWHIIADISIRGRITKSELKKIWRFWRDKWGIGGCDIQERKSFNQPKHAMNYITKYLINPVKNAYPDWFLNLKNVRIIQSSRAVGKLTPYENSPKPANRIKKKIAKARPMIDRLKSCCQSVRVIGERLTSDDKSIYTYIGEIPLSVENIRNINRVPELPFVVYFDDIKRLGYKKVGAVLGGISLESSLYEIKNAVCEVNSYLSFNGITNNSFALIPNS